MRQLEVGDLDRLRSGLGRCETIEDAFADSFGESTLAGGFWRFFSRQEPRGGLLGWNAGEWRRFWDPLPDGCVFVGEDVLGNQLVILRERLALPAMVWSHESGRLASLELDIMSLVDSVRLSGVEWLDFYSDGSARVASQMLARVSGWQHLHWVTPLILGGQVVPENITVIDREPHLVGHGKLWAQIRDLAPGTQVIPKPR